MTTQFMTRALNDICQLAEAQSGGDLTDRYLLDRFASLKDEAAFAQLVRRHGPMVLALCRRVLRNRHDAEDAFQAAFLVLARKARSVRWQDSAGGWLFRVAYHLALKMRAKAGRQRTRAVTEVAGPEPTNDQPDWELRSILEEELSRLPEKYRVALLLGHWEGRSRAEAALQLGWKEGAVKIRLERGRELLRARLARRGLAPSALVLASLLKPDTTLPASLVAATASTARLFSLGKLAAGEAASQSAATLAAGVLKTMMLTRLKIAALLAVAVAITSVGVTLGAIRAFAKTPGDAVPDGPPAQQQQRPEARTETAPEPAPDKPLRVLLFAGGPTREYQFVRSLFAEQVEQKQAELSICLQNAGANAVQDVPAERLLKQFPTRLKAGEKKDDTADQYGNLAMYDVVIAFDADWSQLTKEQAQLVEQWIAKSGGGLILVAGPLNTFELVRPGAGAQKLKPITDALPVNLNDLRIFEKPPDASRPWSLSFPTAVPFVILDGEGKDRLVGWSEFFFDKERTDWQTTGDRPERGFYTAYPVKSVKPNASVVARYRHPQMRARTDDGTVEDVPYLVTMPYGKGRTVYLGSGETWRLRQFNPDFHERFWTQLARYAASAEPSTPGGGSPRNPALTPNQRNAIDKGLAWLARNQKKDGHWGDAEGDSPLAVTALAGTALLMQGSTIGEGAYVKEVRRATDWLMGHKQPDGRIGLAQQVNETGNAMDGHGRALLFLASAYGEEEDRERRVALEKILVRAVEFSVGAQAASGGWGRQGSSPHKEKDDPALVGPTLVQLQALRAARAAGVAVPKQSLDAGRAFLAERVGQSTPAAATVLAAAFSPTEYDTPEAKTWLRAAPKSIPALHPQAKRRAGDDLNLLAFAVLAYNLGDEGHLKLLPMTKPGDVITWSEYRKKIFDYLVKTQNDDGSWDDEVSKNRATALYLTILQLDGGVVPIYQR
jgi:RNA polymerase sigma factor (sigma-70 family)